jgi:hypothetical protein
MKRSKAAINGVDNYAVGDAVDIPASAVRDFNNILSIYDFNIGKAYQPLVKSYLKALEDKAEALCGLWVGPC